MHLIQLFPPLQLADVTPSMYIRTHAGEYVHSCRALGDILCDWIHGHTCDFMLPDSEALKKLQVKQPCSHLACDIPVYQMSC